jgi:hypothetical protein
MDWLRDPGGAALIRLKNPWRGRKKRAPERRRAKGAVFGREPPMFFDGTDSASR